MEYTIRKGIKSDISHVFALINELASYENSLPEVEINEEKLRRDGFGENPLFNFFVAEANGSVIGLALFFTYYSTWKGKCIYIEDLVVTERFRGKGVGKSLFSEVVRHAKEHDFDNVIWQVLNWNQAAKDFYVANGAVLDNNWSNCRLNKEKILNYPLK